MSLILNNSRDIGSKFIFGHWMMRPKNSRVPFIGPGFGRANYWMYTPEYSTVSSSMKLDRVEEDMKLMKKLNLKCYVIEFCGKIAIGDKCWTCCKNDKSLMDVVGGGIFEQGAGLQEGWDPPWEEVETAYFTDEWYEEAKIKYKELIRLCRKYNMWLLNLVFNDNRWQKAGFSDRETSWIKQYGQWREENQKPGSNSGGPEHGPGTRQEELRNALKDTFQSVMPPNVPTYENLENLMKNVIFPCGGQDRVVICPVNEPETNGGGEYPDHNGVKFERDYIPIIKQHGFTACSYGEIKYGAQMYQGGHDSSIASVSCPDGIGVSDNGDLLCELYYDNTEDTKWEDIGGDDTTVEGRAEELIKNYKLSGAKAAMLYAIHYNASEPDTNALAEIRDGWYNTTTTVDPSWPVNPGTGSGSSSNPTRAMAWDACTKSSNWFGSGAARRIMNILSPHMDSDVFTSRYNESCGRGINHFNLFVCNNGDGEYGGYSIYGNGVSGGINTQYCNYMLNRIKFIRNHGYGTILWLMADDDGGWNNTLYNRWNQYCSDLKSKGFFRYASVVVVGLEINEWWGDPAKTNHCCEVLRNYYSGKIGVHTTSGVYSGYFSKADIPFLQIEPDESDSAIRALVRNGISANPGKPIYMCEMSRTENRHKCEVAFDAGAYAVGNW